MVACVNKVLNIFSLVRKIFSKEYYGFIGLHTYIEGEEMLKVESLFHQPNGSIVREYEELFSEQIGGGSSVSYASARMGFFSLLQAFNVQHNDEIILPAATCSVMVNAVLRVGAIPIYSDIDINTFGSSIEGIKKVVSERTKVIVAQHSFGIPCDIQPIIDFAKDKDIFVIEDCALSLGSKRNGIKVGNFGNASIFSTDRSKPLNTVTGGLVYSTDISLIKKLRNMSVDIDDLSSEKQKSIFAYLYYESKYGNPLNTIRILTVFRFFSIFSSKFDAFLVNDFSSTLLDSCSYSYPSRLPSFLAYLGICEIKRWKSVSSQRREMLSSFIDINTKDTISFPKAYFDDSVEIIPHRIVWTQENGPLQRKMLSSFIDISWTWFLKPIVATDEPLESFFYIKGSCPKSESIGFGMVNLPIPIDEGVNTYIGKIILKVSGVG